MASPAVTALLLALAALAAVEAVQPIPDTASSTEMKTWLNNIRIESEGLSDQLWDSVIKGKTPRESINDLLANVTAQINKILRVNKALNTTTIHGCSVKFFADYQVKACEEEVKTNYLSQLKELYTEQQNIAAAVNEFVANLA